MIHDQFYPKCESLAPVITFIRSLSYNAKTIVHVEMMTYIFIVQCNYIKMYNKRDHSENPSFLLLRLSSFIQVHLACMLFILLYSQICLITEQSES